MDCLGLRRSVRQDALRALLRAVTPEPGARLTGDLLVALVILRGAPNSF